MILSSRNLRRAQQRDQKKEAETRVDEHAPFQQNCTGTRSLQFASLESPRRYTGSTWCKLDPGTAATIRERPWRI